MFLSIITTVYNLEDYISECVDSILNQSFSDYELILVNDCSSDNSLQIISKYAEKDERIKIINNKTNLGCGKSRQVGIDGAKGEYLAFIDGDDKISGNYLQRMYESVISTSGDIIVNYSKIFVEFEEDNKWNYREHNKNIDSYNIYSGIFESQEDKLLYLGSPALPYLNNKFIRKSLFNSIPYCERLYIEDMQTHYKLVYNCNKVVTLPDDGQSYYWYRKHEKSLTMSADPDKNALFFTLFNMDVFEYFAFEVEDGSRFSKRFGKHFIMLKVNTFLRNKKINHEELKNRFPSAYSEFLEKWDKIKSYLKI